VINLWHPKFVTADVIAVFVNKNHNIQRWGQNFDNFSSYTAQYLALLRIDKSLRIWIHRSNTSIPWTVAPQFIKLSTLLQHISAVCLQPRQRSLLHCSLLALDHPGRIHISSSCCQNVIGEHGIQLADFLPGVIGIQVTCSGKIKVSHIIFTSYE